MMRFPHQQKGITRTNLVLLTLLALSIAAHIAIASIRQPIGPQYGAVIHGNVTDTPIEPHQLRVATYNIHRGKGTDGNSDLSRIAGNLTNFDIIGLNEVGGAFWPSHDQAAQLGETLQMGWLFDPAQRRWYIDDFGNGMLSRLATVKWQSLPMINDLKKGTGHRHILYADFRLDGEPFTVMIVHAERGEIRDRQIRYIFDEFTRYPRAILMGDFNALPDSAMMREVHKLPGVQSALMTAPHAPGLNEQRDWIFVRGFKVIDAGFKPRGASDHPMVWAKLTVAEH